MHTKNVNCMVLTKISNCNSSDNSCQFHGKNDSLIMHAKIMLTKVVSCNNGYKSYHLQFLHTKAITALTQFFDFSFRCFQPYDA